MAEELNGLTLNTKTISFIMGLISLGSVFWFAVSYVQGQEFRATALESRVGQLEQKLREDSQDGKESLHNILTKIDALSGEVAKLTIALTSVQVRQEGRNP